MVGAGAPVGVAEPSPGQLQPTLASYGRLRPVVVRLSLAMCDRTWPGAAGPAPLLWCSPLRFICSLLFPYLCTYK
jgi:hypothetical protein